MYVKRSKFYEKLTIAILCEKEKFKNINFKFTKIVFCNKGLPSKSGGTAVDLFEKIYKNWLS